MGNNPGIQSHNTQGTPPYPTGRSTLQARGKLALLVPLLALAILLLVPAVVFARDDLPAPQSLTATSGDGDMTLKASRVTTPKELPPTRQDVALFRPEASWLCWSLS